MSISLNRCLQGLYFKIHPRIFSMISELLEIRGAKVLTYPSSASELQGRSRLLTITMAGAKICRTLLY